MEENMSSMSKEHMAQYVSEKLQSLTDQAEGTDFVSVQDHINTHTLNPTFRVSGVLRSLLGVMDKLESTLMTTNEDDVVVVDAKNVAVYLKVVSEVMQVYKTGECGKLMFSESGGTK